MSAYSFAPSLLRRLGCGVAVVLGASVPALAQPGGTEATTREVQWVVPVEPGGGIDAVARVVANHWSTELRLAVTVLNRPGASGNIGTASVARAKADGRTLLVTGVSHLTSPLLHGNPGYAPIDDFVAVARYATAPNVLVVGDTLKGQSLAQILQDPRSTTQGLAFGSAGYGHTSHIAAGLFMARTGARWLHVPYKGTAPALRALMAGEVQVMFVPASSVAAAVATGRVHALAVANAQRIRLLPDTPTLHELGVEQAEFSQWYGLLAPRGTPPETLRKLSSWALQALQSPSVAAQLRAQGIEPDPLDHEQFASFLVAEQRRLAALLKRERVERPLN